VLSETGNTIGPQELQLKACPISLSHLVYKSHEFTVLSNGKLLENDFCMIIFRYDNRQLTFFQ